MVKLKNRYFVPLKEGMSNIPKYDVLPARDANGKLPQTITQQSAVKGDFFILDTSDKRQHLDDAKDVVRLDIDRDTDDHRDWMDISRIDVSAVKKGEE